MPPDRRLLRPTPSFRRDLQGAGRYGFDELSGGLGGVLGGLPSPSIESAISPKPPSPLLAADATPERKLELREELKRMREAQLREVGMLPPELEAEPPASPRLGELGQLPFKSQRRPLGEARGGPPLKDWESTFREEDRTANIEGLKRKRDIAEGLKEAGLGFARLSGVQMPDLDTTAYGIREDITEAQDVVSLADRQALKAQGLNIPEGMKRSMLVQMLPAISGMQRQEGQQEFRRGEAEKEREHERGLAGVRERRAGAAATAKAQEAAKLSDKELEQITQMDQALEGMQAILDERQEKGYWTGPLDKPGAAIGAMTGLISGESAEWRRKVTSQLNQYIKEMTGAQLSKHEASRLMKGLPTESDQEYIFDAKMEGTIKDLERIRETFLRTRKAAGKRTGEFEKIGVDVGGDEYRVPLSELREFVNARSSS